VELTVGLRDRAPATPNVQEEAMDVPPVTKILAAPVAGPIYQCLLTVFAEFGPFELEENKTSIHVVRGRAFLGIHPRKNALPVNIVTARPIVSDRVVRHDQVSANLGHNEMLLRAEADVGAELVAWVTQACELTEQLRG
jgi:hypothetical protein